MAKNDTGIYQAHLRPLVFHAGCQQSIKVLEGIEGKLGVMGRLTHIFRRSNKG